MIKLKLYYCNLINNILYLFAFSVLIISCNYENTNYYKINKNLTNTSFDSLLHNNDSLNLKWGINLMQEMVFSKNDTKNYSGYLPCSAFKSYDSIIFTMAINKGDIDIILNTNKYQVTINNVSEQDTYPDGDEYCSRLNPRLVYHSLVLKSNKFNIGDTLVGYFQAKTMPYRYKKDESILSLTSCYFCYFKTIITSKKNRVPETLHY